MPSSRDYNSSALQLGLVAHTTGGTKQKVSPTRKLS